MLYAIASLIYELPFKCSYSAQQCCTNTSWHLYVSIQTLNVLADTLIHLCVKQVSDIFAYGLYSAASIFWVNYHLSTLNKNLIT